MQTAKRAKLLIKVVKLFFTHKTVGKNDISKSYNRISKSYQQQYLATMHIYNDQLLKHLIINVTQGKILDLAGGTGYNCNYINKNTNYNIDLVDLSKEMLDQCQCDNVNKIRAGMVEYLKKQPEKNYEAIICTWALMYEHPQTVIRQCYRVLKDQGYLYILVNNKQTLPQIRKVYYKLLVKHVNKINKLMLDLPTPKNQNQLNQWAKHAGFKQCTLETLKHDFIFDNWYDAAKFVVSTGALAGYDVMIDLHDHDVFMSLVAELKKLVNKPSITHHFIKGIFYKGED